MENKKLVIPASIGADRDDATTCALPESAVARLGRGQCFNNLAFSPDSRYLAVGTRIGLWLYDLSTCAPIALLDTARGMIFEVVYTNNGEWVAACNQNGVLKIWDLQRGVCITQIEVDWFDSFTFSPDDRWLVVGNHETATINVWEAKTGELLDKKFTSEMKRGNFMPIAYSPNTRLIAATCCAEQDNDAESIIVWDVESCEQISCLTGHNGCILNLCFSPCGQFLASGGLEDGNVHVWDVSTWGQIRVYTDYGSADMYPTYSQEGILYAAAGYFEDGNIFTVWDLEGGTKLYSGELYNGLVEFSSGARLAYLCKNGDIKVWSPGDVSKRIPTFSPISYPNSIVFSEDGKTLAAESRDWRETLLWDIESKRPQSTEKRQYLYTSTGGKSHVVSINRNMLTLQEMGNMNFPAIEFTAHEKEWIRPAYAPAANLLACGDAEGTIIVWDVLSGNEQCKLIHPLIEFSPNNPPSRIEMLEFSPDGKFLISEENTWPSARLWNVEQGEEICEFPGDKVQNVGGFSPCSSYVACGGGKAPDYMLWDVNRSEISAIIQGEESAQSAGEIFRFAFSPCGSYLACGGLLRQPEILVWDINESQIHKRIRLPQKYDNMMALAFSHCGKYLAGGVWWHPSFEKVPIHLWNAETGKLIVTFLGHPTDIQAVAFSPNNELLASASFDGSILLWDLMPYL
ncbi:MAG: hypothetical protein OXM61_04150 [Candidatus Poribacteria bacterium]|nr:hypothetical protein [Candidatus Poribacteria bacterium]